jgi:MOSC domain-containing protein YiiM
LSNEPGVVVAVCSSPTHSMSKPVRMTINLVAGVGVEGDAHAGATVQHRSRVGAVPPKPNLRQVHLIHEALHDELRAAGFDLQPGRMGENVTTRGIDLLGLPAGTLLHLGATAVVRVTGLRNPCTQLVGLSQGLMAATLDRDGEDGLVRKAGIMGVVVEGGEVRAGDVIEISLPPEPREKLDWV